MKQLVIATLSFACLSCATLKGTCDKVHTAADAYSEVLLELERRGVDPSQNTPLVRRLKAVKENLSQAHEVCFDQE